MATEKLKLTTRSERKLGPIHRLKATKRAMISDLPHYRHNTKNRTHIFKILNTSNAICGDNFKFLWVQGPVYKPSNINVVFSQYGP
jgi:hypothetical protein